MLFAQPPCPQETPEEGSRNKKKYYLSKPPSLVFVFETPEEKTRNVVEIEKNIICLTNLPVQKRRGKKEVEIRRNINCQNPLVLSLSLRRCKEEVVCRNIIAQAPSPEANKNHLRITPVHICEFP